MKRWLYLLHRWLGVVLCTFMAMWFVSGVVMMYVGYPKLSDAERLAALPALPSDGCCVGLHAALAAAGRAEPPRAVRLTSVAGEPRFIVGFGRGDVLAVDARRAEPVGAVGEADARRAASAFARGRAGATARPDALRYAGLAHEDAWTHSRALDPHRPLHRVELGDDAGTLVYVSSRTGEVVRDATRVERVWNWVGAWIHWLYPLRGGTLDRWWHEIVVYASVAASLLAAIGMVVGVLRWRLRSPYRSGARTPYRDFAMRWHHWTGLVFGTLAFTWILSGLFSVNPWRLLSSPPLSAPARALAADALTVAPGDAIARFAADGLQARELEWRMVGGQAFVVGYDGHGRTRVLPADGSGEPMPRVPAPALEAHAAAAMPSARVVAIESLERYDLWYYARAPHTMLGHVERRLPALRVRFDDDARTWLHLDPHTGAIVGRYDHRQRVKRFLFAMLHSWDWLPLLERRPLWDVLMLVASAGGLALSITGVVVGWRRVRRKCTPAARARGATGPAGATS